MKFLLLTESFRPGGPFTVLPTLPHDQGPLLLSRVLIPLMRPSQHSRWGCDGDAAKPQRPAGAGGGGGGSPAGQAVAWESEPWSGVGVLFLHPQESLGLQTVFSAAERGAGRLTSKPPEAARTSERGEPESKSLPWMRPPPEPPTPRSG